MKLTTRMLQNYEACDHMIEVFDRMLKVMGKDELDMSVLPPHEWLELGFAPYWGWMAKNLPGNCWSLNGFRLDDLRLQGANLRVVSMRGVWTDYPRNVDLRGAVMIGADLSGAQLTEARMIRAVLSDATLSGAWMNGVDLDFACLSGADMRGICLMCSRLVEASITEADLRCADLSRTNMTNTWAVRADLRGADLKRAKLEGADFTGAKRNHDDPPIPGWVVNEKGRLEREWEWK